MILQKMSTYMLVAAVFCIPAAKRAIAQHDFDTAQQHFCLALKDAKLPSGASVKTRFMPKFDFPSAAPEPETMHWDVIDFTRYPGPFLKAVLAYALEGFDEKDRERWDLHKNSARNWYHAPWMCEGNYGREVINGLTRERTSEPFELWDDQVERQQNWAVSFFNEAGASALHRVWGSDGGKIPDIENVSFPVGTVIAKPLYTAATVKDAPYIAGAPEIEINLHQKVEAGPVPDRIDARTPGKVRLLQFDVAVRLDPAKVKRFVTIENFSGWVYGTFIYNATAGAPLGWESLQPLGLTWGNERDEGAFVPGSLRIPNGNGGYRQYGYEGRVNGPVDNPLSSCLSCHGNAQFRPKLSENTIPWPGSLRIPEHLRQCYFRNLGMTEAFGENPAYTPECGKDADTYRQTGTSLQVTMGLINYCKKATIVSKFPSEVMNYGEMVLKFCGGDTRESSVNPGAQPIFSPDGLQGSGRKALLAERATSKIQVLNEKELDEMLEEISEWYNFSLSRGQ